MLKFEAVSYMREVLMLAVGKGICDIMTYDKGT